MKMKIQVFLSVLILGFWYSIFLVAITKLEYQQALYFNGLETTGIEKYDCNKVVNVLKITDDEPIIISLKTGLNKLGPKQHPTTLKRLFCEQEKEMFRKEVKKRTATSLSVKIT